MKKTSATLLNRFKALPKYLRVTTYFLTSYALYALLVGLVAPAVIQSQAPKMLTELTGRDVSLTEVRINPFILRVQINEFAIAEQDKSGQFAAFEQLELEINFWESVLNLAPTVDHLDLKQASVNIARLEANETETLFNFSDIITYMEEQKSKQPPEERVTEPEQPTDENAELFPFIAHSIRLQQADFAFADKVTGADLKYNNINFALSELNTRAFTLSLPEQTADGKPLQLNELANQYTFGLTGADQSQLDLAGQFQLKPLEVSGDIKLTQLQLLPYWPLSDNIIKAELTNGVINLESQYHLKQQEEAFLINTDQGYFSLSQLIFAYQKADKARLGKLEVKDIALNTATQEVNLGGLFLDGIWADAVLTEQGLDLQALFTPEEQATPEQTTSAETSSENTKTAATETETKPWLVHLNEFSMTETDLNVKEAMVSKGVHWRVYPLNLSTKELLSDLSQPIEYDLSVGISSHTKQKPEDRRGQFTSSGKLDAKTIDIDGEMALTALDLRQLQPYLDPHLNLTLNRGTFSTSGKFVADSKGKLLFSGKSAIDSLLIKDTIEREPLIKWKKMSVDSIKFNQSANTLKINTILFDHPYAKVLIAKDKRTNIGEVTNTGDPASPETEADKTALTESSEGDTKEAQSEPPKAVQEAEQGTKYAVDIKQIKIINGSAFFADYSLKPNFATGIELLEGYIKNISSTPGTTAEVDLKGKVDRYAPVSLTGEINPLIVPPYVDLKFSLKSAELTSVNPYSGTYAGYYIDKGQLSLDVNYRIENNQLQGDNHIVVDQLTLGKKSDSEEATSLPVGLAIALLQDSDGVIDLGFQVEGNTEDPEFSVGGAVLKIVGNIITKAVTAPFSLLANLVGSDDEMNYVDFEAGLATLDAGQSDRLEKLSKALQSRPKLKVNIEGSVLPLEDSRALAESELHTKLLKLSALAELPDNLSASRIPASGPITNALHQLFESELKTTVIDEKAKVEQKLIADKNGAEVTEEELTTVLNLGMYNQLLSAQEVDDHDLGELADARARIVKAFLVEHEIEPSRVYVLDSRSELKTEQRQALLSIDGG